MNKDAFSDEARRLTACGTLFLTDGESLIYTCTHDERWLHASFQMDDGKVLIVEHVLCNSPSLLVVTYESREKYIENLLELYWAIDPDYIISIDDELKKELEQRGVFDDE